MLPNLKRTKLGDKLSSVTDRMKSRVYYTKPSVTELEVGYVTDAVRNGWGEKCYEYIHRFEQLFATHLGTQHVIATSSCTGALHMGLAALGIGPGDEVIMADTNWAATAAPIVHLGATPVFVDILPDSWCLDPELVEQSITPHTKAIIAVHLYGNLCDMKKLLDIGSKYDIPVVEDAAESLGSVYYGRHAGSMGRFGVFSFHGSKTLTTGEGGAFVTNDPDIYEHALTLSNHGRARGQSKQFWADIVGFKYKMSNIQAALGCAQMERIDELIKRKREIFQAYSGALDDFSGVTMNPEPTGTKNGYWMPTLVCAPELSLTREIMQSAFLAENIDARVIFWPLTSTDAFGRYLVDGSERPIAHFIADRGINLPSYHDMTEENIMRVLGTLQKLLSGINDRDGCN